MKQTAFEMVHPPPAIANYSRLLDQQRRIWQPSPLSQIQRTTSMMQQFSGAASPLRIAAPHVANTLQTTAAFTAARTHEQMRRMITAQASQNRLALDRAALHVQRAMSRPDPAVMNSFSRAARSAAARLADADKLRVRNALTHWSRLNNGARWDRFPPLIIQQQLWTWQDIGNGKLRSFARTLEKAFEHYVLDPIASALHGSEILRVHARQADAQPPGVLDRIVESLLHLKRSNSPHAPPFAPA
jgi:hypothetical protein